MDFFEEIKCITDLYMAGVRAGAGLPQLKTARQQVPKSATVGAVSQAVEPPAPAAASDPLSASCPKCGEIGRGLSHCNYCDEFIPMLLTEAPAAPDDIIDTEQDAYARKRGFRNIDELLDGRKDR